MSSDISRQRFNPANDFSGVLMQQGRVQLDADWNEWNDIRDRRWRSETIDIIGRCVVPLQTPNGFQIQINGSSFTIGPGRIYVDGLQAENHGAGDPQFDPVLAESAGPDPLPYEAQPYLPNAPALPNDGGPHLVYLDVWEREVTSIEDPALVENAVGVDTTSRVQTAWQVRVLPNVGSNATCGAPDETLPGWLEITAPSAGRLTTAAVGVATSDDPCLIPPSGGYRGLENRTYRVEIHEGGAVGAATFKWSRDNASIATGVSAIENDTTLTVDRAVWDSARRFSPGDWVEITDDWREFSGAPGDIRRIASVVDATRTITLDSGLTSGAFPVSGQNLTDPARHTRIKRWDQSGLVKESNGNTYVDLDASGGSGLIEVPDAGTSLILEDGVEVTFTVAPSGSGVFRSGDYWIFVARTADASVEALAAAPPRGVHHHYGRLGLITFPSTVVDCRTFWPPSLGEGESCDCTVCVTAEEHNSGQLTIQTAVNQLLQSGGTICLGPGIFNLREPVNLTGAKGIRIRGQGAATIVLQPRSQSAFIFNEAFWCTLDYLTIQCPIPGFEAAIAISDSVGLTIERIIVAATAQGTVPPAGISLSGAFIGETHLRDNLIWANTGVIFTPNEKAGEWLLLGGFSCERNFFQCSQCGIRLDGTIYYGSDTLLARNLIAGTTSSGISATGVAVPRLQICGNTINPAKGDGIVVGTGGADVIGNQVNNVSDGAGQSGIRIVKGNSSLLAQPIVVRGNLLQNLQANGLTIEVLVGFLTVAENTFSSLGGYGIVMLEGGVAFAVRVLGNEFLNVANATTAVGLAAFDVGAIYLPAVFESAVSGNTITNVGANAPLAKTIFAIRVDNGVDLRVSDNTITDLGPADAFATRAIAIFVNGALVNIEIADNLVKRRAIGTTGNDNSPWQAIAIVGGSAGIVANSLHGFGSAPIVSAQLSGSCRFSDNHCTDTNELLSAEVALEANSVIAANNRIEGPARAHSLEITASARSFTVLGNIVSGEIFVNGAGIAPPWQPLNVVFV